MAFIRQSATLNFTITLVILTLAISLVGLFPSPECLTVSCTTTNVGWLSNSTCSNQSLLSCKVVNNSLRSLLDNSEEAVSPFSISSRTEVNGVVTSLGDYPVVIRTSRIPSLITCLNLDLCICSERSFEHVLAFNLWVSSKLVGISSCPYRIGHCTYYIIVNWCWLWSLFNLNLSDSDLLCFRNVRLDDETTSLHFVSNCFVSYELKAFRNSLNLIVWNEFYSRITSLVDRDVASSEFSNCVVETSCRSCNSNLFRNDANNLLCLYTSFFTSLCRNNDTCCCRNCFLRITCPCSSLLSSE